VTPAEAAQLIALIAAATGDRPPEGSPDAWSFILDDLPIGDAMDAVRDIARRPQPRDRRLVVTPDMVLVEARRIRRERIAAAEDSFEPSPATRDDPAAYIAELRAHRQAAADGTLGTAPALAARPTLADDMRARREYLEASADPAADMRARSEYLGVTPRGDQP